LEKSIQPEDIIIINNSRLYWGWSWYAIGPGSVNPLMADYQLVSRIGNLIVGLKDPLLYIAEGRKIYYIRRDIDTPFHPPENSNIISIPIFQSSRLIIEEISKLQ
jgi:hypothetical protein